MDLIWTSTFLTVSISPFPVFTLSLVLVGKSLEVSVLQGFYSRLGVKIAEYS